MIKIIKRDGVKVPFEPAKIVNAIMKAMGAVGASNQSLAEGISSRIVFEVTDSDRDEYSVSEIHSLVEMHLGNYCAEVGEAYKDFRKQRDKARESGSFIHKQIMGLIHRTDKELLDENLNKDSRVLHTQRDLLAGIICKHYGLNHILPKEISDAHKAGEIWWHDMDYSPFFPITNCCTVDLDFMFKNGFKIGSAEVSTPKSITTAAAITSQVVAQVASAQFGGTTIGDLDITLSPYVEKSWEKHFNKGVRFGVVDPQSYADELTSEETYNAMQSLLYEVNTLHTSNGQQPFVTFGFGMGKTWSAKLIQESVLKNQMNGLGEKKVTPVFPKLIFAVEAGHNLNKGDPFYSVKQLAVECSSKRFYPDYLGVKLNKEITGSDKVQYAMG